MSVIRHASNALWLMTGLAIAATPAAAQDDQPDILFAPEEESATPAAPAQPQPSGAGEQPAAAAPTPVPEPATAVNSPTLGPVRKAPERLFGTYRLRLGLAQPKFDDGLKYYDELYDRPSMYPTITADWFAWDWYATLGLSFSLGFYTDEGHAAKELTKPLSEVGASDIEQDKNSPTTLTLIPLRVCLAAEIAPLARKWLVVDGWVGVERLYWQEVRAGSDADSAAGAVMLADSGSEDDALTNKGWKNASVVGLAANILLNGLDGMSAASLQTMGLGYVYLSPYMEIVKTVSESGVSFGRSVLGVAFTFESLR